MDHRWQNDSESIPITHEDKPGNSHHAMLENRIGAWGDLKPIEFMRYFEFLDG